MDQMSSPDKCCWRKTDSEQLKDRDEIKINVIEQSMCKVLTGAEDKKAANKNSRAFSNSICVFLAKISRAVVIINVDVNAVLVNTMSIRQKYLNVELNMEKVSILYLLL